MRTNAWLSFFHRMRFFPEREKQNERYLGKLPPEVPDDMIDWTGRGVPSLLTVASVLDTGGPFSNRFAAPFVKCERNPNPLDFKSLVHILPSLPEGSF
jgi:hypothetical protein